VQSNNSSEGSGSYDSDESGERLEPWELAIPDFVLNAEDRSNVNLTSEGKELFAPEPQSSIDKANK
jgi:hypothetical protein